MSAISQDDLNRHATHHVFVLIKDGYGWVARCAECEETILESRVNKDVSVI